MVDVVAVSVKTPALRDRVARSRAVVCLLLVGLLLYNPFLSFIHSSTGLSVHHLPRYRATVGASELRHFSPVSRGVAERVLLEASTGETDTSSNGQDSPLAPDLTRDRVIAPDYSSNLWFRPPPSA